MFQEDSFHIIDEAFVFPSTSLSLSPKLQLLPKTHVAFCLESGNGQPHVTTLPAQLEWQYSNVTFNSTDVASADWLKNTWLNSMVLLAHISYFQCCMFYCYWLKTQLNTIGWLWCNT